MSQLRIGLAGFGYWGERLARNIANSENLELVAIADPDAQHLHAAGAGHQSSSLYPNFEDLRSCDELDAIILATPAFTHGDLALKVLESGKHVFVEKPLALDVLAARRIVDTASERNLIAMVGHTFLYSPAVQFMRDLVSNGSFGVVKQIECRRLLGQIRLDCDVMWDLAPHDISILLYLVKEVPDSVTARSFSHLDPSICDASSAVLTFPSGMDAQITVGWVHPQKIRLLTIIGERQMAIYDDVPIDKKVTVYGAGLDDALPTELKLSKSSKSFAELDRKNSAGDVFIPVLSTTEPLRAELEAFGEACALGEQPESSAGFGLDVVRVLEAITRSASENGASVRVR
jgi:predicted dehydrogenase